MSDSVRPQRGQPTRLPRPWDSPGKNTGVGCHFLLQCMKVKSESEVSQSCPTLSDPMDCSLPGSSVHGIFQARVLEWGAIAFSIEDATLVKRQSGWSDLYTKPLLYWLIEFSQSLKIKKEESTKIMNFQLYQLSTQCQLKFTSTPSCCCCRFSCIRLCATPETAAYQAPLSLGFSRQEHWSGLPFPSPMQESEK